MGRLILITGGARSGKSSYAEQRAAELGGDNVLYVATSQILDEEMRDRVRKHQAQRPSAWQTIEAPLNVAAAIRDQAQIADQIILLDCLTLLTTNILMQAAGPEGDAFNEPSSDPFATEIESAVLREVNALIELAQQSQGTMLVVTNEIGLGVVPPYELGRAYRDILGRANQVFAAASDEVILMVAGIPMSVK